MWFRGVAASMGLCLDLGAILEGHPDVVLDQMRSIRILWVSLIFFKMGLLLVLRYKDQSVIFLIEENV